MFRLDPKPSFWLTVLIPEAGGEGQRMRAEFCYMTLEEYKAHFMVMARKPVAEFLTPGSIGEGGLLIGWATTDAEDGRPTSSVLTSDPHIRSPRPSRK